MRVGRWLGDSPCASGVGPWCMAGLAGWPGLGWLDLLAGWLGWLAGLGRAELGWACWLGWLAGWAGWLVGLLACFKKASKIYCPGPGRRRTEKTKTQPNLVRS